MIQFKSVVRTHVGAVRHDNEDSAFAGSSLLLVADGVGGAAAGEVASASATYVVSAAALMEGDVIDPVTILDRAVGFANRHIGNAALARSDRHGMSTTLTAILTDGQQVVIAHAGDSRAYLMRAGRLKRLTRDDTLLQELLDSGAVTPAEAPTYPYRNIITKCLGQQSDAGALIEAIDIEPGDRLLLCSDGVSDFLDDVELQKSLLQPLDVAADQIVETTLQRRGADNITCVIADVVDRRWVRPYGTVAGAAWEPANLINGSVVRSAPDPDRSVLSFH